METIVKRIETVYLPVQNPAASAEWYRHNLKLAHAAPIEPNATQAQLLVGSGQSLFLIKSKEPIHANFTEIGGEEQCMLTLEVEQFQELHERLSKDGVMVTKIEDHEGCGENFYVYDPDGNKLDIWSGWPKEREG
ncbi:catechol-2,3-dioxygenase [Sporosarcina luteola]|nr:catechol-2,3-dioxygenase [Sporosarcina luteola]